MKSVLYFILSVFSILSVSAQTNYIPSEENLKSREDFANDRFGIFIHWGLYSMLGQGEWFLNYDTNAEEYKKLAKAFYPVDFDAKKWVKAFKDAGAKYVCITSRHHDGFSMFGTEASDYNIVDATPFKRDILKELAEECRKEGIALHFYYSHLDWTRPDYPQGRTGKDTGRDASQADWDSYYNFMNSQLTELLTNYGPIRAIWFDGWWDHDEDPTPFDWQLPQQYALIHSLQPGCLIGNNHHQVPFPGEDIQIFERDLPGQNDYGLSGQSISALPLETCNTMNGMWGYKIKDLDYKSADTLIQYLVKAAGLNANLLLNIGPQPNGELPELALERLSQVGKWLEVNGETIYGTRGTGCTDQSWGTATRKGAKLFVHILSPESNIIVVPFEGSIKSAEEFETKKSVKFSNEEGNILLHLDSIPKSVDFIVECEINEG